MEITACDLETQGLTAVDQGHWKWHHSIDCIWLPIHILQ